MSLVAASSNCFKAECEQLQHYFATNSTTCSVSQTQNTPSLDDSSNTIHLGNTNDFDTGDSAAIMTELSADKSDICPTMSMNSKTSAVFKSTSIILSQQQNHYDQQNIFNANSCDRLTQNPDFYGATKNLNPISSFYQEDSINTCHTDGSRTNSYQKEENYSPYVTLTDAQRPFVVSMSPSEFHEEITALSKFSMCKDTCAGERGLHIENQPFGLADEISRRNRDFIQSETCSSVETTGDTTLDIINTSNSNTTSMTELKQITSSKSRESALSNLDSQGMLFQDISATLRIPEVCYDGVRSAERLENQTSENLLFPDLAELHCTKSINLVKKDELLYASSLENTLTTSEQFNEPTSLTGDSPVKASNMLNDETDWKNSDTDTDTVLDAGDDNFLYVTRWQEKEQRNCKLMLATSLNYLQPPPHFSTVRNEVLSDFKGKKIYLFLDYDGTLTPIVRNPWEAHLSSHMRQLLYGLASDSKNMVTVGIVTGRALTSVKNFVQIVASENLNFIYAASHGFHIEAAGKMLHHRVGSKFIPILKAAAEKVAEALKHISGIALEDNEFAVTVHYRNAAEDAESEVSQIVHDIISTYPELKITRGKKVFELRINVVWNKGRAVFWLLNAMRVDPFDENTRVIYMGDDLTDEDAFKAVRTLQNCLTVLVSDTPASRATAATCYVKDPDEVADLLENIFEVVRQNNFIE